MIQTVYRVILAVTKNFMQSNFGSKEKSDVDCTGGKSDPARLAISPAAVQLCPDTRQAQQS